MLLIRVRLPVKKKRGDDVKKQKLKKIVVTVVLTGAAVFLLLLLLGTVAHAAGLVDDTVSEDNLYSEYPLDHYQLDFYVDTGWDWLPWNWNDGIGKQVMYGLYTITNFIWIISLYLDWKSKRMKSSHVSISYDVIFMIHIM